jgi:hypothetical protein
MARERVSSPVHHRLREHDLRCRIIRVPSGLDTLLQTLKPHFHWDHWRYFPLLVRAMACMGGRRHVAHLYRDLEPPHHRTRFNNFFLVVRGDPEAALRQKAQERLRALPPPPGETRDWILDESQHATRGQAMDAVATRKDPTTDAYIRGHQDGGAIFGCRDHVMPWGRRRSGTPEPCAALPLPCRHTTELAAQRIRAFDAPAGVTVMVRFEAYARCAAVVHACRAPGVHVASTLTSHRRLFQHGWKRNAGRDGQTLLRRRRTQTRVRVKPHGQAPDRDLDAGWLPGSSLGPRPVVRSRHGQARTSLGLVTDAPPLSAARLLLADERRWTIAPCVKDATQLWGLGQYQNRPDRAAVLHLPLVWFADALLTHLRLARPGAPGPRTRKNAVGLSVAMPPEARRALLWDDLVTYLKEQHHGEAVIAALERLRVA